MSDLHDHQQVLNHLWQAILDGKEQEVLQRIRSGASIRDVADHLNGVFTIRSTETREDAATMRTTAPMHKGIDSAAYAVSVPVELSVNESLTESNIAGTVADSSMLPLFLRHAQPGWVMLIHNLLISTDSMPVGGCANTFSHATFETFIPSTNLLRAGLEYRLLASGRKLSG